MRYVLAAILIGALGAPAASALPAVNLKSASATQADPIAQVAKRGKPQAQRQNRGSGGANNNSSNNSGGGNTGGIHPLVGSGDY